MNLPVVKIEGNRKFEDYLAALLPDKSIIVISTYRSGSVLLGSFNDDFGWIWHNWIHEIPSGMSSTRDTLNIATIDSIKSYSLNKIYPFFRSDHVKQNNSDSRTVEISALKVQNTGKILCHEIWSPSHDLSYLVNTRHSALSTLDNGVFNQQYWMPPFISEFVPDDLCHLNGLAIRNSVPAFVTCLAGSNLPRGWRLFPSNSGLLIDIINNKVISNGLTLPHSPRFVDDRLYFLQSGISSLCFLDIKTEVVLTITELPGFARGMAIVDNYAIIGMSTIRNSNLWDSLPVKSKFPNAHPGLVIVDLKTGCIVSQHCIEDSFFEIFDVQIIP